MKKGRELELLARLAIVQRLSVADAVELLGVSESTARRIFAKLEKDGRAIRTHGGIRSIGNSISYYSFDEVAKTNITQKAAIAKLASEFVQDGDVIFCDSGTTVQCFCAALSSRLQREELDVAVYTNSLANLEILPSSLAVKLLGGEYRANRKDFCGYIAEQSTDMLHFTKSFLGADGCADCKAFTTTDFETTRINRIAMQNSDKTYMLVDASKFKRSAHVKYARVTELHAIVTDDGIEAQTLKALKETGTEVFCAPVSDDK